MHGVRCDDPVVLAYHTNTLVHLRPAPVVARIATVTAAFRPGADGLRRELTVAGYLAAGGAPVVPPSDDLPPGPRTPRAVPHVLAVRRSARGGRPGGGGSRPARDPSPTRGVPDPLPSFDPLPETDRLLRVVALEPKDSALLGRARSEAAAVLADLSTDQQALHGDAHLSNISPRAAGSAGSISRTPARGRSNGISPGSSPQHASGVTRRAKPLPSPPTKITTRRSSPCARSSPPPGVSTRWRRERGTRHEPRAGSPGGASATPDPRGHLTRLGRRGGRLRRPQATGVQVRQVVRLEICSGARVDRP
jgi:hypothetical protein